MISLSGLALGIGMLVDNSIVVIENIYRLRGRRRSRARGPPSRAPGKMAGAIVSSTLTTVCVFLPLLFAQRPGPGTAHRYGTDYHLQPAGLADRGVDRGALRRVPPY